MKKILASLLLCVVCFSVLPIHASAWGGYIAIRGESTYHDPYCEELEGAEYSKLLWFDTQKQAESAGLSPCDVCDSGIEYDFSELNKSYFITNDKKLDALFDAVLDYGLNNGYENGYAEGYSEASQGVEDRDGYGLGKSEGYRKGYQAGKEDYASADYSDGFNDGYDKMKVEAEKEMQKMSIEHDTELHKVESKIPFAWIITSAIAAYFVGYEVCKSKTSSESVKLEQENKKLKHIIEKLSNENETR